MPPLRRHGPELHVDISYTKPFVTTSPPTSPLWSADTPSVETPLSAPEPSYNPETPVSATVPSYNPARRRSSTYIKFDPLDPDFTLETNILTKPQYPYSTMIAFAIKSSAQQMLTLNEIYVWFEENYPYFKTAPPGWKNSIRHNLSLNPGFVKTARPVHEPGKGSYWALDIQKLSEGSKQKKCRKPYDESSPTKSRRGSQKLYPSPPSSAHPGHEYSTSSHLQSFSNLYGSLPDLRSAVDVYDSSPRFFDLATADSNDTMAFPEEVEMEVSPYAQPSHLAYPSAPYTPHQHAASLQTSPYASLHMPPETQYRFLKPTYPSASDITSLVHTQTYRSASSPSPFYSYPSFQETPYDLHQTPTPPHIGPPSLSGSENFFKSEPTSLPITPPRAVTPAQNSFDPSEFIYAGSRTVSAHPSQLFEGLVEEDRSFESTLLGGLDLDAEAGQVEGKELMEFKDLALVLLSEEGYQKMCYEENVGRSAGSPF